MGGMAYCHVITTECPNCGKKIYTVKGGAETIECKKCRLYYDPWYGTWRNTPIIPDDEEEVQHE